MRMFFYGRDMRYVKHLERFPVEYQSYDYVIGTCAIYHNI